MAFVLIMLAPLASQLCAEPADWRWLNELGCHDGAGSVPAPTSSSSPVLQVDACGYCSLLSHCPVLADDGSVLASRLELSRDTSLRLPERPLLGANFPHALSRAPPMRT
ncbi:DUF2946 domain-containing protein [Pseudomonas chengduensis]|uniref:DUF2946 domain-containing protein n=1 Tax=Ectopseudomonas oleovorans TaxID=301 RepID=A0AB35KUH1_ECTOL|nr:MULTISPECIES: DUF2946 domain-containing protein [Pseudomonas]MDG9977713.1 DUF2946 domain-containing protein [Pseudomonas oleovorans]MDH0566553.1 DUF2946 domain-containing protein [Pseudomonas oleovorans]MDH1667326.1 DUF2946 domain-containing protein [Pseudomonas chengduensis]